MDGPGPGRAVLGSTTGRPLMAALDLLGRRWALRILWELRNSPSGARELRQRCDAMSPSVMYQRLTELTSAGLVIQDDDARYRLSALGQALREAIEPLDHWARSWADHRGRPPVAEPNGPATDDGRPAERRRGDSPGAAPTPRAGRARASEPANPESAERLGL